MRKTHIRRRDEGFAMLLVLVVIAALSVLGIVGSRSAQTELRIAEKDLLGKQALSAAEAGINDAYARLKSSAGLTNELSNNGTGGVLVNLGSLASLSGVNYRFKQLGTGANDGYYVKAIDNWDEQTGTNDPNTDRDNKIQIMSRGRAGAAERVVLVWVTVAPSTGPGFFGDQYITLSGGTGFADSFDSSIGPYNVSNGSGANIRTNDTAKKSTVSGGFKIKGNYTTAGATTKVNATDVSGAVTTGATPLSYPPVPACGPPYSPPAGISGGKYDSTKGTWTVSGGGTGTLAPGTYCFATVTLSGGGSLDISGLTKMYATGQVNLSGGTFSNPTGLASNFQLYSSLNAPNNGNGVVISSGGADSYMSIYAPKTGITFSGGGQFYGQAIGASLTASGGMKLHYDVSLGGGPGGGTNLSGWHEARN